MANRNVKVTREGDQFTCQGEADKKPVSVDLNCILAVSSDMARNYSEVSSALYLLQSLLTANAKLGNELNESETHGMAALCGLIQTAMDSEAAEHFEELAAIKILASVGVSNA